MAVASAPDPADADLAGRVAVITGSTRGIGLATARRLVRRGACVVVNSRTEDEAATLKDLDLGERAAFVASDVSEVAGAQRLVDLTLARFGRVDVWVNNASPNVKIDFFDQQQPADWHKTIDGKMFGGVTTVTASHSSGAEQTMTIEDAGLSTGTHTIGLAFINDAWGGSLSQDRNLYLNGAQLNGVDQHVSAALMTPSTAVFRVGQSLTPGVTMEGASSLLSGLTTSVTPGIPTQATSASSGIANLQVHQSTAGSTALLMGHT